MEHLFKLRNRCLPKYTSRDVTKLSNYNKYEYAFKQTQKVPNFCPSFLQTAAYSNNGVSVTPKSLRGRIGTSIPNPRNFIQQNRNIISPLHNRSGANSPFSKAGHSNMPMRDFDLTSQDIMSPKSGQFSIRPKSVLNKGIRDQVKNAASRNGGLDEETKKELILKRMGMGKSQQSRRPPGTMNKEQFMRLTKNTYEPDAGKFVGSLKKRHQRKSQASMSKTFQENVQPDIGKHLESGDSLLPPQI